MSTSKSRGLDCGGLRVVKGWMIVGAEGADIS